MAKNTKRSTKQPATEQDKVQQDQGEKGYAGSQDYQTGKVSSSDPAQATDEQIKEDRARQRGTF
jgi:hypothetical protein